jgi:anhydro-N-acetylmuramic acid kinase
MTSTLYIGLMSGTSLDGVDGVLVDFGAASGGHTMLRLAHAHRPFPPELAHEFLALNRPGGTDELHRAALAGNALARLYAQVVERLCIEADRSPEAVCAIGAHGQTVRHRPQEFDGIGYTVQLSSPALLAELSGIDVIADLRSRDVAAGGQGAPLVPAFHRAIFGRANEAAAILNLGGIGNLTALHADGSTSGFDCGPGNVLMDHWCSSHTGQVFDRDGAWAASGTVDAALLSRWLADPYFAMAPPKSTGRDRFNPEWLHRSLQADASPRRPADVQATLAELTAATCVAAVQQYGARPSELIVCGGGAFNGHLMRRLAALLPAMVVRRSDAHGLPASEVEACAFAWLARAFVEREPASLPSVTGATGARVLGALYPAR